MGILRETAIFLEEEKNITREDIHIFKKFLSEDIRSDIYDIWAKIKTLASEKKNGV